MNTVKQFLLSVCVLLSGSPFISAGNEAAGDERLIDRFYALNNNSLMWFGEGDYFPDKRMKLVQVIDSCAYFGLNPDDYPINEMKERLQGPANGRGLVSEDRLFTEAALLFFKDLKAGRNITHLIGYDALSSKARPADEEWLVHKLLAVQAPGDIRRLIDEAEPHDTIYHRLKNELAQQLAFNDRKKIRQLSITLNYYRWILHFGFSQSIVVNIPSATLGYYVGGSLVLTMRTVVGKPATRTPRFAAYCDKVILYPYWNVPSSIKPELLNGILRDRRLLDVMGLQVLDSRGNVMNPKSINWKAYSKYNFPYRLRQTTGCENALGVIKFNLTSPFGVYLHDTNVKSVFALSNRYFSHGCIRLEKPVELGNYLLDNKIDTAFLAACVRNQQPLTFELEQPVPVFVVYLPCGINDQGKVDYYKDIYNLL